MHYVRWKTKGTTDLVPKPPKPPCAISDCDKRSTKRGWCDTHYRRWQRYGDPTKLDERWVPLPEDDAPADERWLPVPEHEGLYEVSDYGRIRSLDRVSEYAGRRRRIRGRILRPRPMLSGHLQVHLAKDGVNENRLVHHLVLLAFVGPRPDAMEGCHNDGDPANNRVGNIRWDTRSANCYDRVRHGRDHKRNRTACPHGHLLQAPNLVACLAAKGTRGCLTCSRTRAAQRKARMADRPFDFEIAAAGRYAAIMASPATSR